MHCHLQRASRIHYLTSIFILFYGIWYHLWSASQLSCTLNLITTLFHPFIFHVFHLTSVFILWYMIPFIICITAELYSKFNYYLISSIYILCIFHLYDMYSVGKIDRRYFWIDGIPPGLFIYVWNHISWIAYLRVFFVYIYMRTLCTIRPPCTVTWYWKLSVCKSSKNQHLSIQAPILTIFGGKSIVIF